MPGADVQSYERALCRMRAAKHVLDNMDAPINEQDEDGITRLMAAAILGAENASEELIKQGADVKIADRNGWTALHRACLLGHTSTVKILLENGADPNALDVDGFTPTHYACMDRGFGAHKHEFLPLLVEFGADVNLQDNLGRSSLEYAVLDRHLDMIKTLTKAGSNFPANFEYLFASLPYTQISSTKRMYKNYDAVRCISYLINSKWDNAKDAFPHDKSTKNVYQHPTSFKQDFDFISANQKSLGADPRVQWIRKALLNEHIPNDPQDQVTVANTLKSLFIPKLKLYSYATPKRLHPIPLHRALSCKTCWCSWMSHEGYIQALVKVNPKAIQEQDPLTGLFAYQIAALRTDDLDSVYNLLLMAPDLLPSKNMKSNCLTGIAKCFAGLKTIRRAINKKVEQIRENRLLRFLFLASGTIYFSRYYFMLCSLLIKVLMKTIKDSFFILKNSYVN